MVAGARHLIATRGKSIERIDTADVDDEQLRRLVLGPTGNLRAPTMRIGNTLVIGFDAGALSTVLEIVD